MLSRSSACLPARLGQHSPSYGPFLSYCSGSATEQEKFFSRLGQNSWHTRQVSVFALGPVRFFLAHHMHDLESKGCSNGTSESVTTACHTEDCGVLLISTRSLRQSRHEYSSGVARATWKERTTTMTTLSQALSTP